MTQPVHLDLSMTLPGSASLGAYQAGAVSALGSLITTARGRGHKVTLDALGGSSAGSIVGLLFAHCLLTGRDTESVMTKAWIDEVDLDLLRTSGSTSPLAFDDLERRMRELLTDEEELPVGIHASLDTGIIYEVGLTSLLGFSTTVQTESETSETLTYVDWSEFLMEPDHDLESLFDRSNGPSPIQTALVSASHPLGFCPAALDRTREWDRYRSNGINNLPDEPQSLWFSDGGLVEARPVGRILHAAKRRRRERDSSPDAVRMHLVVDPRSSGPTGDDQWLDEAPKPWIDGVRRAMSIVPTQALHDDLRGVASVNDSLDKLQELVEELAPACSLDRSDLEAKLAHFADLVGREKVHVANISPLLLTQHRDDGVSDLLAGDFVGAFGGFLERDIRRSDFTLGWDCVAAWAPDALTRLGLDDSEIESICARVTTTDQSWRLDDLEGDGVDQLSAKGRWRLALFAAQLGRVVLRSATPSWSPPLDWLPGRSETSQPDETSDADEATGSDETGDSDETGESVET